MASIGARLSGPGTLVGFRPNPEPGRLTARVGVEPGCVTNLFGAPKPPEYRPHGNARPVPTHRGVCSRAISSMHAHASSSGDHSSRVIRPSKPLAGPQISFKRRRQHGPCPVTLCWPPQRPTPARQFVTHSCKISTQPLSAQTLWGALAAIAGPPRIQQRPLRLLDPNPQRLPIPVQVPILTSTSSTSTLSYSYMS